jgi:uncharacterized protein (DUF1778 family)
MSKPRTSQLPKESTAPAVERVAMPDTKGSINLRIDTNTRQLIDEAATILGKTRTEFMIESPRV